MKRKYRFKTITVREVTKTTKWWNQQYKKYQKLFNQEKTKFDKKGLEFADPKMLTKAEFREQMAINIDEYKQRNWQRASINQLSIKQMVNDQKYELSHGYFRAVRQYATEYGEFKDTISYRKLRSKGQEYLKTLNINWDYVTDMYADLKAKGHSGKEAGQIIGQSFFGSPK